MFERQRTGSLLCPSCRQLVGVNDPECFHCGRKNPGLFGYAGLLRGFDADHVFVTLVMWTCAALFLCALAIDVSGIRFGGDLFRPSTASLFVLGASGEVPVFRIGRWWTFLSAGWLHGGLVHIVFNMLWLRDLGPVMAHVFGTGRTILVYVLAGASGFLASTLAARFLPDIPFLGGASFTVGASAAVFGFFGALQHYSEISGNSMLKQTIRAWLIGGVVIGFILPGIDNWAHAGGYVGGYLLARVFDPRQPPRPWHAAAAGLALLASLAALLASVVTGLQLFPNRG